jgi:hypothetical protein
MINHGKHRRIYCNSLHINKTKFDTFHNSRKVLYYFEQGEIQWLKLFFPCIIGILNLLKFFLLFFCKNYILGMLGYLWLVELNIFRFNIFTYRQVVKNLFHCLCFTELSNQYSCLHS